VVGLQLALKVQYQNGGNFSVKFMNISVMGPRTELSYANRTWIMCWLQEKIPNSEIAARLGHHPSTIWRHAAVMKKLPPNLLPPTAAARSGCPMKATDRERKEEAEGLCSEVTF
jgi:hypothetical protein